MKIEKKTNGAKEKLVLSHMIDKTSLLGPISTRWQDRGLFESKQANIIGQLCVDYYREYGKAPRGAFQSLMEAWIEENVNDENLADTIRNMLASMSREYERNGKVNSDYLKNLATELFEEVRLSNLVREVQDNLESHKIKKARELVVACSEVEIRTGNGVDVIGDTEEIKSVFTDPPESFALYDEALNNFFHGALEPDAFIVFMAPEKTGKSWWLMDLAFRAAIQGKQVAFFEVGDMSKRQVLERFYVRAAAWPYRSPHNKWPYTVNIPKAVYPPTQTRGGEFKCAEVEMITKKYKERLSDVRAVKACETISTEIGLRHLMFNDYPTSTVTALGLRSQLKSWSFSGWLPDIVVIDYVDILAPINTKDEHRHQINRTWEELRKMAQELHCLVVTATQADADSYDRRVLTKSNFTGDKRKNGIATGICGLNVTAEEKEKGVFRLNWVALRGMEFSPRKFCHVAGCLPIGNPAIVSTF